MTFTPGVYPFELFGTSHIAVMLTLVLLYVLIFIFRRSLRRPKTDLSFRMGVAAILLIQEIGLHIYRYQVGLWTLDYALPLHFCNMMILASIYLMFTGNKTVFDVVYLFGLAGTLQAILTPAVEEGFPHFRFFQFFIAHGFIILSSLYYVFVHGYRVDFKSVKRTFLIVNLLVPPIMLINWLTGGNYNNLNRVPDVPTLIDYLGPWPWYLIPLELLAITFLLLAYLPFYLLSRKERATTATQSR